MCFWYAISISILTTFSSSLFAHDNPSMRIKGRILNSEFESLSFADISLWHQDSILLEGTSSDFEGLFQLSFSYNKAYDYSLRIDYVGSKTFLKKLDLNPSDSFIDLGNIYLEEGYEIAEVSVNGQSGEEDWADLCCASALVFKQANTIQSKSVLDANALQKVNAPNNLVDMLSLASGVEENVACGVCFTNNLSINGLAGQYTAILIDGTPMYGNLASVYGLNGIPSSLIDYVEITKGPNSAMYGSEAVAGVLNVITKDPKKQALIQLDLRGSSHLESFNNIIFSPKIGKNVHASFGVDYAYMNSYYDSNEDGFGDIVNMDRISAFGKINLDRPQNRKLTLFARYYSEDRRNGVEAFLRKRAYKRLRGDSNIYGESIYTKRWEILGAYDLPTQAFARLDYSFSGHYQDSYYGVDHYTAQQYIVYTNLNGRRYIKKHDLSTGLTFRYQYYNDNTVATPDSINKGNLHQFIAGGYVEDAWEITDKFALLFGTRLDYYQKHGLIPAPRFNLRYKPSVWTTFRLNMGTGFRIVNLFTEDHAFVTGNRQLEILEDLNPERSYNINAQFSHLIDMGKGFGSLNFEAYYTYFTNAIFPDYSEAHKIIYKNLEAYAQVMGLNFSYNQQFEFPLSMTFSGGWSYGEQNEKDDAGNRNADRLVFAPFWNGNWVVAYNISPWQLSLAYSGTITGPMRLPEVFDLNGSGQPELTARPTQSKPFSIQTFQINKGFEKANLVLYMGIQNLLNYKQSLSPLVGYNDPNTRAGFSDYFDTAYAYSSIDGREFYLGLRWFLHKKKP